MSGYDLAKMTDDEAVELITKLIESRLQVEFMRKLISRIADVIFDNSSRNFIEERLNKVV